MTAQNDRSPFRSQRWVECAGQSLEFGDCVEITESTRRVTSNGIDTIFQVTTPTAASSPNTIIIGHLEGSKGYCTNDFPTYAKCDQSVNVGDEVGPLAGSRVLSPYAKGYLVMGDIQGGMARVRRSDASGLTTIVFTMLTDRTREIVGGLTIGYADVSITGKVGTAGEVVGSTVKVVFADERWLESVKGCKGIADYVYDPVKAALLGHPTPWFWIVKEVQGLVQGFWAITDEDRTAGAPQQDVRVIVPVVQNVGHANDDYSVNDWGGQPTGQQQQSCTGNAVWTHNTQGNGQWQLTTPCGTGCTSLQNPNELFFAPPPFTGQTFTSPCVSSGGSQSGRTLKVRYVAGSFPHMLKGALCYCTLDNDITNTSDNTTMIHYVVQSDQMAKQLDTTLAAKMCGTDPSVGAIAARTFWPFSQVPVPDPTITNPHSHYGMPGDKIIAEWSEHYQRWEVVEVDKHLLTFSRITDATDENGCRTIAWTNQNFAGEICEPATAGGSLELKQDSVTGITSFGFTDGETGSGSGVQCNPKLTIGTRTVQVWTACGQATTGVLEIPLVQETVVVDLNMDGCPTWATSVVIVFGNCGDDAQKAAVCEPCPEGSGSGSG